MLTWQALRNAEASLSERDRQLRICEHKLQLGTRELDAQIVAAKQARLVC